MGQKMSYRHLFGAVSVPSQQLDEIFWEVLGDRIVKTQAPLFDEAQGGGCNEGFCVARNPDRVLRSHFGTD
jgi:hypothetical protein